MTRIQKIDLAKVEQRVLAVAGKKLKTHFTRADLTHFLEGKHQSYLNEPERLVTVWVSLSDHECEAWSVSTHLVIRPGLNQMMSADLFRLKRDPRTALRVFDMTWTPLKAAYQMAYPL